MEHGFDAIVLGAGAAGLMCAARAGQRGRRVLVLERASAPGKKILISGGGRCNFTNIGAGPANYLSANPHFAKSALARYTAQDFLELVESYGIAWHEKTLGQLFCDGSAKQIVALLLEECAKGGVEIRCGEEIARVEQDDGFTITTQTGSYRAPALVIATGGPSIPKMGATGFAYDLARQFGLKLVEPRPALVPLTLGGEEVLFRDISGVSAPVAVSANEASFAEAALFTHRGLSGPAILQASSYWRPGEPLFVDFLPQRDAAWLLDAKRANPRAGLRAHLRDAFPARLADILTDKLALEGELGNLPDKALRAAGERLKRWEFRPNGTEGFAKAEVTVGGISTAELSSKTMAAKRIPGLYTIGEAVDVTGWLGGYNFQWAWASGVAAGDAL
ncbi:NAD(P)/FAD-dependent oxidoreductase [Qipengyuania profunda]|jgi:predicted Rossmann fold flavoprotein|uniref:NAD(P)/FAD-dependent oxidoreductase n=1 Tax=Qipengyuania profunda TaxID=3113984 RepID=UPI002A18AE65|nr:NAD(P)/FAD-dependent oxidoreductase [Qipengyuania sp. HL-TH1]WPL56417.1 NAD(P)/FAD-dependent oxidoreductase [Qipengyuania sp. HL-TH5]